MMSESGAEIALTQAGFPELPLDQPLSVTVEILEENLVLRGEVVRTGVNGEFPTVRVAFQALTVEQERRLVEALYCRPGQWKRHCSPGELQSLMLLGRILLKPRILFDRNADINAMTVAKV